ncbi:hypothetical protein [Paracoccus zhejiangensis]|uniref:Uncharacterized protein n=1 Tax=Paracoccus zhejiangensis TaxID=1077935 RepID=A0A2H5F0Y3_9RHOB|nr:hypothetical protein [Paracoccus zhejiangensis]AUH65219.1 hypothetical protein CX676_14430 [Paracoccus zhejiangensis]
MPLLDPNQENAVFAIFVYGEGRKLISATGATEYADAEAEIDRIAPQGDYALIELYKRNPHAPEDQWGELIETYEPGDF